MNEYDWLTPCGWLEEHLRNVDWPPPPEFPCRKMLTRDCPPSYHAVCGDRPCARFESEDETPWLIDQPNG